MATYNQSQASNLNSTGTDNTTQFFTNYFEPSYTVSTGTNDSYLSWFEQVTGDAESARLLSATIINTAHKNGEDPDKVLEEIQKLPIGTLNSMLALYLNSSRVTTSLLGVVNTPVTNKYVARTVVW